MSLLSAMLLDPCRDPREVWIALRNDGQRGSGTHDDPYDGTVKVIPISELADLTWDADEHREAVATIPASAQGLLVEGDVVVISGVTGAGAGAWNGTFAIVDIEATENNCEFRYWMAQAPAALPGEDDQILISKRTYQFDERMRQFGAQPTTYMRIHLGPGTFETRGYSDAVAGQTAPIWKLKEGMKISGGGMGVTVVKLVYPWIPDAHFVAFGGPYSPLLPYVEISDLTVDCNLPGLPPTRGVDYAAVSCGAVYTPGSHTRVRRVRAVNFGTQTIKAECFVIVLGGTHPTLDEVVDCVIEDCIAERPSWNNVRETTVLGIGGTPALAEQKPSYHRGCVIRRNVVNCTYSRNEVPIQSIALDGQDAVVTTLRPHGRNPGDWVVISGAIADGSELNNFNGSYRISVDPDDVTETTFKYTPQQPTPGSNPTGTMFVDGFSSHYVPVVSDSIEQVSGLIYRLRTETPHNRIPGNNVVLSDVDVEGFGKLNVFNGSFPVLEDGLSARELKFQLPRTPEEGTIDSSAARVGVQFHIGGGAGTCQVVEHNRVIGATYGVYDDTGSTRSLHLRKNHFHRVRIGVYRNLGNYLSPPGPIAGSCLTYSKDGSTHIATFTSIEPHGLSPDDQVTIGGASVGNENPDAPYTNVYNGTFNVSALPSPNQLYQFQYELPGPPPGDVPANAAGSPVFSPGPTLNVVTAVSLGPVSTGSKTARFVSSTPHGFQTEDIVSVFGAKMDDASAGTFFNPYNGVFPILRLSDYEFRYDMLSPPSGSALTSPAPQCAKQVGTALTRIGTTAIFNTVRPHFLEAGQIVWVEGALVSGGGTSPFNARGFALRPLGMTSFAYEMAAVPATHAYGAPGYRGKDMEGLLQIENNVIELVTNLHASDDNAHFLTSGGVGMGAGDFRSNPVFRQVVMRGNLVRHVDNALDRAEMATGFGGWNCGAALIQGNVFALNKEWPIVFGQSGIVSCVNNLRPQGTVVEGYDDSSGRATAFSFAAAEDALGLAML